jgi:hypothetical protein
VNRFDLTDVLIVGGVQEFDPLCPVLYRYRPSNYKFYVINNDEPSQPDLVSYRSGHGESLWWLLLIVNNIEEPFFAFNPGDQVKIPNLVEVYALTRSIKSRRVVQVPPTVMVSKPVVSQVDDSQFILDE